MKQEDIDEVTRATVEDMRGWRQRYAGKLRAARCKRCGGRNGKHKQVDDPQAGNSHMLTLMPCPLDKGRRL